MLTTGKEGVQEMENNWQLKMMAVCLSCKQTVLWFQASAAAGGTFLCSLDKEVGASLAQSSQHLLPLAIQLPRIGCPSQNAPGGLGAGS